MKSLVGVVLAKEMCSAGVSITGVIAIFAARQTVREKRVNAQIGAAEVTDEPTSFSCRVTHKDLKITVRSYAAIKAFSLKSSG